jgi:uncharacterized repeat protein (TIGR01451 family)
MHRSIERVMAFALCVAVLAAPATAIAQGDVSVALTAHRVSTSSGGQETLVSAEQARPGEVIEYRATYRNDGSGKVRSLVATMPVPNGMEYLPRTAQPTVVLASLDGKSFAPVPLKRKVRLADGREVTRDVPASEYRWLRWPIGSLDAKSAETVRARVRVSPVEPMATVIPAR